MAPKAITAGVLLTRHLMKKTRHEFKEMQNDKTE